MARAGGLRPDGLSIHHAGRKTGEKRPRPPSPNFFGSTTTEGNTHASSKPSIHERQPVPLSFRPQLGQFIGQTLSPAEQRLLPFAALLSLVNQQSDHHQPLPLGLQ